MIHAPNTPPSHGERPGKDGDGPWVMPGRTPTVGRAQESASRLVGGLSLPDTQTRAVSPFLPFHLSQNGCSRDLGRQQLSQQ